MKKIMTLAVLMTPPLLASAQEEPHLSAEDARTRRPTPLHQLTWQEVRDGVPVAPPQSQFVQAGENVWVFDPPTPYFSPAHGRRNSR